MVKESTKTSTVAGITSSTNSLVLATGAFINPPTFISILENSIESEKVLVVLFHKSSADFSSYNAASLVYNVREPLAKVCLEEVVAVASWQECIAALRGT